MKKSDNFDQGKPLVAYIIVVFLVIGIFEALHHIPGLEIVSAFRFDHIGFQIIMLLAGLALFMIMTGLSYKTSCRNFEVLDL